MRIRNHEPEKAKFNQEIVYVCALADQMATLLGAYHPDYIFVDPKIQEFLDHMGITNAQLRPVLEICFDRAKNIPFYETES